MRQKFEHRQPLVVKFMKEHYKNERFRDQRFPVYCSQQRGSGVLVIPHFHKAAELLLVTDGTVTASINGQNHICAQGDVIFLPPYSVHSVISDDMAAGIQGLVFDFSLITADVLGLSPEKILNKNMITDHILEKGDPVCISLGHAIRQAAETYHRNGPTCKLEILSCLHKITALLINHYFHQDVDYSNYDRLQPVLTYIDQNYAQEISLAQLSSILNICDDHLIRLFKAATGKTPIKYIVELRFQKALRLLINTDLSITECACQAGFSNISYMSRIFHSRLNLTPGQYRRNSKKHRL